jgi:tRNA(Ile)-lysidine synthase
MLKPLKTYLFYFLKPYGFNADDVIDVMNSLGKQSGKKFSSSTHQLVKDRYKLIISTIRQKERTEFIIEKLEDFKKLPISIEAKMVAKNQLKTIKKDKHLAYLNAEKVTFPLVLRKWKTGDKFKPLGMKGMKKLSDFFVDEKFSLVEKEKVWILTANNKIVWVVGHRIDDDFKITEHIKDIIQLKVK